MTVYNRATFAAAHTKFLEDAKLLTDADIEQFAIVDPGLADRARARRQGLAPVESELERKHDALPVNRRDVMEAINDVLMPLLATYRYKTKTLEARVAALESKPSLKYCGIHERGREYQPGEAVTHSGSLWVCKVSTKSAPQEDFIAWQLGVKRGRG